MSSLPSSVFFFLLPSDPFPCSHERSCIKEHLWRKHASLLKQKTLRIKHLSFERLRKGRNITSHLVIMFHTYPLLFALAFPFHLCGLSAMSHAALTLPLCFLIKFSCLSCSSRSYPSLSSAPLTQSLAHDLSLPPPLWLPSF